MQTNPNPARSDIARPLLVSTGRGSYVDPAKVSLDDILYAYDRCPLEFIDEPRDSVIASYHAATIPHMHARGARR